ncbi:type II toxin-antitoxin system RatA family toxin [Halovenus sp. HT40]|uniref:type II toxin-antitoxin system RatA family toxin n=1 Tax=Halovenus sp. HT40 TaxID=3126691 RepID=UPI00300F1A03
MDRLEVSTLVYLPPEEIYDFLVDFPRYAKYSEYLDDIRRYGDGTPETEYDLTFAWWKLSYTARSRVTGVEPPARIDWELIKDLDASGYWGIEPEPDAAPEDEPTASRVRFYVEFDPASASAGAIDLPALTSFDWVVDKVTPKIRAEAEQIVRRIVRDLEGRRREVPLEIHETPQSV